jgi:hypothetical protein
MAETQTRKQPSPFDLSNELLVKIFTEIQSSLEHDRTSSHFQTDANFVPPNQLASLRLISRRANEIATPLHYRKVKGQLSVH